MLMTFRLTTLSLVLAFTGCGIVFSPFRATEVREQKISHVTGAALIVTSRNGAIEVVADQNAVDVYVTAEITAGGSTQGNADERLAQTDLSVTRAADGTLTITTAFPEPHFTGDGANLTIRLPDAAKIEAKTSNGAIAVSGFDAPSMLTTSNGRITLRDMTGNTRATASNGRITIEQHSGDIDVRTSNGPITITDVTGRVSARTSNGAINVTLAEDAAGPLDLQTSNGRVTATVGTAFGGEVALSTSNGSISVRDGSGAIQSQNIQRRSGTVVMNREGEPSRIRTSNGRIEVRMRGSDS